MTIRRKIMRMRVAIVVIVLFSFGLLLYTGCKSSISIEERIEMFVTDLNTKRGNAYSNFQTDDPLDYDAIKAADFWEIDFPVGDSTPYTYSNLNTDVPSNVIMSMYGPTVFVSPKTVKFVMVQEGKDWYIRELYIEGNPIIPIP